jgi:hypothetical protein
MWDQVIKCPFYLLSQCEVGTTSYCLFNIFIFSYLVFLLHSCHTGGDQPAGVDHAAAPGRQPGPHHCLLWPPQRPCPWLPRAPAPIIDSPGSRPAKPRTNAAARPRRHLGLPQPHRHGRNRLIVPSVGGNRARRWTPTQQPCEKCRSPPKGTWPKAPSETNGTHCRNHLSC